MDKVEVISFKMKDGDNNPLSTISVNKKLAHKDHDKCILNDFDLSIEGKFVETETEFLTA